LNTDFSHKMTTSQVPWNSPTFCDTPTPAAVTCVIFNSTINQGGTAKHCHNHKHKVSNWQFLMTGFLTDAFPQFCSMSWHFTNNSQISGHFPDKQISDLYQVYCTAVAQGQIQGGSLGSDEPPSQTKKFFWSNSCRQGAEFGEVNRLGDMKREVGVVETGLEE